MNKKILVPLDSSELAEKVLPYAIQLTSRFQTETVLLHVSAAGEFESTGMRKAYIEHTAEKVREQLQEICPKSKLSAGNIPVLVKSEVIAGDVASSILKYALSTQVVQGTMVKIQVRYDNEFGYSKRLLDVIERLDL